MNHELLVHQCLLQVGDHDYEVKVFTRSDGSHVAKTAFGPEDIIINDGTTLDEALDKHRRLLPLAVNSRQMLREMRRRL